MRKILFALSVISLTVSAPAYADPPAHAPAHGKRAKDAQRIYDANGRYLTPKALSSSDRVWKDSDGRMRCKRDNGTTGLVIGAAVGALAGHELAGRGDKTLGTIIGAVGGGLLGRAIDRGDLKCS
jgi:hypothetical protein